MPRCLQPNSCHACHNAPSAFSTGWPPRRTRQDLGPKVHWLINELVWSEVLGLYLVCDLLDHLQDPQQPTTYTCFRKCVPENFSFPLVFGGEKHPMLRKEHSESAWPIFMPKIFESIFDSDADARTLKPWWLMWLLRHCVHTRHTYVCLTWSHIKSRFISLISWFDVFFCMTNCIRDESWPSYLFGISFGCFVLRALVRRRSLNSVTQWRWTATRSERIKTKRHVSWKHAIT